MLDLSTVHVHVHVYRKRSFLSSHLELNFTPVGSTPYSHPAVHTPDCYGTVSVFVSERIVTGPPVHTTHSRPPIHTCPSTPQVHTHSSHLTVHTSHVHTSCFRDRYTPFHTRKLGDCYGTDSNRLTCNRLEPKVTGSHSWGGVNTSTDCNRL